MRLVHGSVIALVVALVVPGLDGAQAQDPDKKVAGGGITAPGWKGKVDAASAAKGMAIGDSKFAMQGKDLMIQTGPPAAYWNPANTAKGDYTVKATFKDMKSDAGHPHPVGVFIGGANLDTDTPSYLYCVAYTDGSFLVRQFNNGKVETLQRKTPNEAVKKPEASGVSTNEVGWTVKGGRAECAINGKTVAGFDAAPPATGPARIASVDGIYGLRVAHNMSTTVTGFAKN